MKLREHIRVAQVQAAEDAMIASIPADLMEHMKQAEKKFRARGGCKGCGSQLLAVHYGQCPTDDLY